MTKYLTKYLFESLKYHCGKDLILDKNTEIRFVRVLKATKIKYFKNWSPWLLILFSNDYIDFAEKRIQENHINFYTIYSKDAEQYFLIGIEFYYFENGTKKETRFCLKPINSLINNLLSSKYDIVA